MLNLDNNIEFITDKNFTQGSPLPYSVLNNHFTNAAYPDKKLEVRNGGFGSDAAAHPTNANQFYVLTDRGPNADFKGSLGAGKLFLLPDYTPCIGLFELQADGQIIKIKEILLKDSQGKPITGLPNPKAFGGTNEIPYDATGNLMTLNPELPFDKVTNPIKTDINGLDPEGLAALNDGSFWISDEYGPHLVHYSSDGIEIERINPFADDKRNKVIINGKPILLPAELSNRRANRGMESLTITPDQSTLVAIMESAMDNPDNSARSSDLTRLVTIHLQTGQVRQFLYRLNKASHVTSGIVALNSHEFYVIEHDRKFPLQAQEAQKHIYKIDISQATDIEAITKDNKDNSNRLIRFKQDESLGLLVNKQTLEQLLVSDENWQALIEVAIKPIYKKLVVDVLKVIDYPHDKLEGLWLRQDGSLGLLNDDDFSITDANDTTIDSSMVSQLDNLVEQKYLDSYKTIEDANRLYIVVPSE